MVRLLKGQVAEIESDAAVVWVGGLGLSVHCTKPTLAKLSKGQEVTFHTHLRVREGDLSLYGFLDRREQALFERLLSVSGVGPRMALALLGTLGVEALAGAIASGDLESLTTAPGIGKRLAERIVVELKGKVEAEVAPAISPDQVPALEASEALLALGFKESRVRAVVAKLARAHPQATTEDLIRQALKELR